MNMLRAHVHKSLYFLCGLCSDATGIYAVSMSAKSEDLGFVMVIKYDGPTFLGLDDKLKDAIHNYIKELPLVDNRKLMD